MTTTQNVTITQSQITVIAMVAIVVSLAGAIIGYDRSVHQSQIIQSMDERVRTLEAYEAARTNRRSPDVERCL